MTLLPDFNLEVYLGKWEFAARWHMTPSDAQTLTIKELLALADPDDRAAWEELPLSYIETWGTPKLRAAIAATYQGVASDDVLAFAGAEEGIYCAMHALLTKDDHAIVVTPNYQSAEQLPLALCATEGVALRADRNWDLDLEELAAKIRPNTKLISINFPHNPTGKVIDRATFDALVALCRKHGIWLFSDEVYRGLELDHAKQLPAAVEAYERGLSLGVMSKAYGLPGLRVGWIACKDHALLSRMEQHEALSLDLQCRAERASLDHRAQGARQGDRPQPRAAQGQRRIGRQLLQRISRLVRMAPAGRRLRRLSALSRPRGRRDLLPAPGGRGRRGAAARLDLPLQPHARRRRTASASASAASTPRTGWM